MSEGPEYRACLEFLYRLRPFSAKLGLETTLELARLAGNPQSGLTFIHVAGTNGKGSTCAMLESIYRHSGHRVGLFTSPHLTQFGERIQVNRQPIAHHDVIRLTNQLKPLLRQFPAQTHPTFFEVVTVLALSYFQEQKCDVVVWETGLGGRLDSTNIVTPAASVITSISLDHQQWLGDTLAQIAAEKAGIIKPRIPVITSVDQPEVLEVISRIAERSESPLIRVSADPNPLVPTTIPLPGPCQRLNAKLAAETARVTASRISVNDTAIKLGLESVNWPGRAELVHSPSGQRYLLDGAHNPAAAEALVDTLKEQFPSETPTLVLGLFADKAIESICRHLAPRFGRIFTVPIPSDRTAPASTVATACAQFNSAADITTCGSLEAALQVSGGHGMIVVTGSLYLVGHARELLGLTPGDHTLERALNEWTGPRPSAGPPSESSPPRSR